MNNELVRYSDPHCIWVIKHANLFFESRYYVIGYFEISKQDAVVLWSKSSTLDLKVEESNPAAANFSFEVDDLDAVVYIDRVPYFHY